MKNLIITLTTALIIMANQVWAQKDSLANQNTNVTRAIKTLVAGDKLKHAQIAVMAVDTKNGDIICQHNQDMSLTPASNLKLFSTAAALELYGPNFKYETELLYSGNIDSNGLLIGDIIIKGGGDPTLGSRFFTNSNPNYIKQMAEAIKSAGIKNVQGNVIGDATIYGDEVLPTTWSWEDIGNYYGAVPSGLSNHDNMTTLHFKTDELGTTAQYTGCSPEVKGMIIDCRAVSSNVTRENTNTFGLPYQFYKTVIGPMPQKKDDVTVRTIIPDPALFMAQELCDTLSSMGISTLGRPFNAKNNKKYLATKDSISKVSILKITSPALSEIIEQTNIWSVNLFAEHCLSLVGLKQVKTTEINSACGALMQFWKKKGMDIEGMSINDGCGLSHYNIITPRQMCFLLTYMRNSKNYNTFNASLTMCGQRGTMSSMCKNTAAWKNARGKSGSIRRVKAYSGYVKSKSGRELAFSILINNFSGTSAEAKNDMEKIISALADFNL